MPEGHTIHRYARLHTARLGGRQIRAWSPQGRFDEGARRLDGTTLLRADAYGKHLFYRFEPAGTLHVHLGLFGHFRLFEDEPPPPTDGTRLALHTSDGATVYLAGATAVELIDDAHEAAIRSRLGPDPLEPGADISPFARALARRSVGVGQALLDQRAIAGVGNVFRSEVLFLTGIHPDTPARSLTPDQVDQVWALLRRLLREGERTGRIVTVSADDRSRPPSRLRRDERVYVYRRAGLPCRRCGDTVVSWLLGGRLVFACATDQVRGA